MAQPYGSPYAPKHSRILKPTAGPPRYIVEIYFRKPFTGETTNNAVHSVQSSAWAKGKYLERSTLRRLLADLCTCTLREAIAHVFDWRHH